MAPGGCTTVGVKEGRMNAEGFEIEYKVWVSVRRGRRIEPDVEFRIPESHASRAGVAENCEGCVVRVPVHRPKKADAWGRGEDLHCPREVLANAVVDPDKRS